MQLSVGFSPRQGVYTGVAALLGAAALPPLGLWPLALVSTAFFIWIIRDQNATQARSIGILYGLFYGLGTMYWFFGLFGVFAVSLVAIMAGYFGLLATLIGMTRGQGALARAALIGLFAVGVEWLRGDAWYLRFPWYTVPHALAASPACVSLARWLGVYGLSGVVWFLAAAGAFRHPSLWLGALLLPAGSLFLPAVPPPDCR